LYDYRSRLIHNFRDQHGFRVEQKLVDGTFKVKILTSKKLIKSFKYIEEQNEFDEITLAFIASNFIKKTFFEFEKLLDSLVIEIKSHSNYYQNLKQPKSKNGFMFISVNPDTKLAEPLSEILWKQYKNTTTNK
jgi:hypothetical protein